MQEAFGGYTMKNYQLLFSAETTLNNLSVSLSVGTQSIAHGDDGLLLDMRDSGLVGEHHGQMGPPVSPFLISTALRAEHCCKNSYLRRVMSQVFVLRMLYRGHHRDSPRQQLEDGLQGITGR